MPVNDPGDGHSRRDTRPNPADGAVRRPAIVAHRGASGEAPENTLAAFRLAWRQQADGIELDIRLSADGAVVVHHDAGTRRCAGVDLPVAATDADTLRRLDVGAWRGPAYAGERIPLLGDVLAEAPDRGRVLIELKSGPETVAPLTRLLAPDGDAARLRIALISFRLDSLLACRRALPWLPCYPVFSSRDEDAEPGTDSALWFRRAAEHGFRGLDPDYRDIDPAFAARARAAGLELFCWTVDDPDEARRLAALGVDVLTSNWPLRIRQAIAAGAHRMRAGPLQE